jgi:hypothetical protein
MFWKKSPTLKIECFNLNYQLIKLFPIVSSKESIPDWWQKLPRTFKFNSSVDIPTMRTCPGFIEFFKRGITIPLWQDHKITWANNRLIEVQVPGGVNPENQTSHPGEQFNFAFKNWTNVKLMSPWNLRTKREVPFLVVEALWNKPNLEDWALPPGVLEFKYQHTTHLNMFLPPVQRIGELEIPAGTPMVHLIPLESVNIELEFIEMTREQSNSFRLFPWSFNNSYHKTKKILQSKEIQ